MSEAGRDDEGGIDIEAWISRVVGGMKQMERREWAVPNRGRDYCVASFVVRCLANPGCQGSDEILASILARREEVGGDG